MARIMFGIRISRMGDYDLSLLFFNALDWERDMIWDERFRRDDLRK